MTKEQQELITSVLDDIYGDDEGKLFATDIPNWEEFKTSLFSNQNPQQINALIDTCIRYQKDKKEALVFTIMYNMWINNKLTDDFIIKNVRSYKTADAIAKTAALFLVPELATNSIRIEHLLNLILSNAKGHKIFSRGVLHQLLNKKLSNSEWARQEDPPEDLFSGNIALQNGNFLMLEGIWEQNIATTQMLLDVLQYLAGSRNQYEKIFKIVLDILKISDAILLDVGISAYMSPIGGGDGNGELLLPDNNKITELSEALKFDSNKLKQLSISEESLNFFVLENLAYIDNIIQTETTLHSHPIIKIDNIYIIVPCFLGFAIRKFILKEINKYDLLDDFEKTLFQKQTYRIFRFIFEPISNKIKLSHPDYLSWGIAYQIYQIDIDKIAYVIYIADTLKNKADKDWSSCNTLPDNLINYIIISCEKLSQTYPNGIIIIVLGNIGGGLMAAIDKKSIKYKFTFFSLNDFELLLHHKDFTLLKLWKCKCQEDELHKNGTHIVNASGDINLFAYWLSNNYNLLPYGIDKKEIFNRLYIPTDSLLSIRKYVRSLLNIHAVEFHKNEYVVVQRREINHYVPSYNMKNIYVVIDYVFSGIFLFLIEGIKCRIWINFNETDNQKHDLSEITYLICDILTFWLEKGIDQIENIINQKEPHVFHIIVSFSNFEKYPFNNIEDIPDNPPIKIKYYFDGTIFIEIDISFLKRMNVPENNAERELIATIINCIYSIVNNKRFEEVEENIIWNIIERIFKYKRYSRQMHMFYTNDVDDMLPITEEKIILAPDEDISSIENSLNFSISELEKNNVLKLLNKFVDILYRDIIKRLTLFDKKKLIIKALENNDKIRKEITLWKRTTAAIISNHYDEDEAHNAIEIYTSKYNINSQISRVLVEIALCHCTDHGKEITFTDIEYLFAEIYKLLEFGRISDALYYDLIDLDEFGIDNGMLFFKNKKTIDSIMDKYNISIVSQYIEHNKNIYSDLYKQKYQQSKEKIQDKLFASFKKAYKEEFGFNYELPIEIAYSLAKFAIDNKKTYLDINYTELTNILEKSPISTTKNDEIKKCIDYFTLNVRTQFEEPKGSPNFRNNSIWLFKRPLSLSFKPYIKIATDKYLLFPRLLCIACEYFFISCYDGELDHTMFNGKILKYFGHRRNEIGQIFNDNVAKWFIDKGFETRSNIPMTMVGAKDKKNDLGDIDVVAFDKTGNFLFIIECKNLEKAKTPREMGRQIKRFLKGSERWLSRHIARYKWVIDNKTNVIKQLKMGNANTKIVPILLVNDIVPLKFMINLNYPTENIITMSQLEEGFLYNIKTNYYPQS